MPDLAFDDSHDPPPSSRGRKKARRRGGPKFVGLFIFFLLAATAGGGLYYFWDSLPIHGDDEPGKGLKAQANFTIALPGAWRNDSELRAKFRAQVAASRRKPRGHFALAYRDYRTRTPAEGELFDNALKQLRGFFPQLEYINPFEQDNRGRTTDLAGEPGTAFTFSATDATEVALRGQCYMLTRHGYAYWLFFWGPEEYADALAEDFAGLRGKFKLHNERDGWKPRPRESVPHTGTDFPYQLTYAKEVWTAEANPKDADPSADLFLRGFEPAEDDETGQRRVVRLAGNAAEVLVLTLPQSATLAAAAKAAQEHVRKRHREANPDARIETIIDPKTGKPVVGKQVGAFPGQVDRLYLRLGPEAEKFGLLAVARRPQGVLVIYGECKWDRRDYWEQELKALLETVRPTPKAP